MLAGGYVSCMQMKEYLYMFTTNSLFLFLFFFLLFISEMILTRNIIVCGYTNGEVRAMDKRVAAKLLFENSYKSQMIGSVAFDDKLLVSGCDDGQVNVFNFLQL